MLFENRFSPLEIFRAKKYADVRLNRALFEQNATLKRALDMTIAQEWCRLSASEKLPYLERANQMALVYIGKERGYDTMKKVIKESECFKEIKLDFDLDKRRGLARICCSSDRDTRDATNSPDTVTRIYRVQVPPLSSLRRRDVTEPTLRRRQRRGQKQYDDVSPTSRLLLSRTLRERGLDPEASRQRHIQTLRSDDVVGCLCSECLDQA